MAKKVNINTDKDFYLHKVNQFKENKKDKEIRKNNNTPLLYMHKGEWQAYKNTLSKP